MGLKDKYHNNMISKPPVQAHRILKKCSHPKQSPLEWALSEGSRNSNKTIKLPPTEQRIVFNGMEHSVCQFFSTTHRGKKQLHYSDQSYIILCMKRALETVSLTLNIKKLGTKIVSKQSKANKVNMKKDNRPISLVYLLWL